MPPRTGLIMLPWTDGNQVVWAMGRQDDGTRQRIRVCLRDWRKRQKSVNDLTAKRSPRPPPFSPGTTTPKGAPVFPYDKFTPLVAAMNKLMTARVESVADEMDPRASNRKALAEAGDSSNLIRYHYSKEQHEGTPPAFSSGSRRSN